MKLYDAPRCPYCARVRITLAEKRLSYESIEIDLSNRPGWLYDFNPSGRVPVLDDGFVLPESAVIMGYLEERYPDPLLPDDPVERAKAHLLVFRFDEILAGEYYAFRRGEPNELPQRLHALEVGQSLFADIAYVPWVIRARDMLGVDLPEGLEAWLAELSKRPSIAAEVDLVGTL